MYLWVREDPWGIKIDLQHLLDGQTVVPGLPTQM